MRRLRWICWNPEPPSNLPEGGDPPPGTHGFATRQSLATTAAFGLPSSWGPAFLLLLSWPRRHMWLLGGRSCSIAKWPYQVKERERECFEEREREIERERENLSEVEKGWDNEEEGRKAHRHPWRSEEHDYGKGLGKGEREERKRNNEIRLLGRALMGHLNGFLKFQNFLLSFWNPALTPI